MDREAVCDTTVDAWINVRLAGESRHVCPAGHSPGQGCDFLVPRDIEQPQRRARAYCVRKGHQPVVGQRKGFEVGKMADGDRDRRDLIALCVFYEGEIKSRSNAQRSLMNIYIQDRRCVTRMQVFSIWIFDWTIVFNLEPGSFILLSNRLLPATLETALPAVREPATLNNPRYSREVF